MQRGISCLFLQTIDQECDPIGGGTCSLRSCHTGCWADSSKHHVDDTRIPIRQDTRDHAMEIDAASCAMMASLSACGSLPKVRSPDPPSTPANAGVENIVDVAILSRLNCVSTLSFDTRRGMCAFLASFRGVRSDPIMRFSDRR
jgi:hypothetical protein